MLLPSRAKRQAIVASGARVAGKDLTSYTMRTGLPWQQQALTLYDLVPELHFAAQFYARMLQKVVLYPAHIGDPGNPVKITSGPAFDTLQAIQDPGGGRSKLLASYGKLMFITGEGYLFGKDLSDEGPGEWSFVWRDELRFDDLGGVTAILAPGYPPVHFGPIPDNAYEPVSPGSAVAYRIWTPHPRYSGWADSPMRGVLEIGEELLILTKSVHSTATSRLARGGILAMPNEIAPPAVEAIGDEDPLNDPFLAEFLEHIQASIQEPSSASATAPYVVWAAGEYLAQIRHISTHDSQTDYVERDLRTEAIQRLSYGLDLPPEALTGFGGSNHWAAYAIMDMIWNDHGVPMTQQFCNDVNEVFLRPSLREQGFGDWEQIIIGYDATSVVVNPDRSDDANEAWDRGAIGYEGFRQLKNIPESMAQTPEEHAEWLETKIVRVRDTNPTGTPADLPSTKQDTPIPGQGAPPGGPGAVQQGRVASGLELGAAQLAVLRCREVAGAKIRTRSDKLPGTVNGQPNAVLASVVGPTVLRDIGVGETRDLVRGGAAAFGMLLQEWGYSEAQAQALCEMIEVFAARHLFDMKAPMLPASFAAHLEATREAA